QVEGSNDIADLNLKDGEVRYSPVVTHRVGHIGATPVRNITVQNQRTLPTASTVAFETELVRVDRVSLPAGQSTSAHTHLRSHLLVAVHGGSVKMEAQGYPTSTQAMKPGDFDWHTGTYSHNVTNVGTTAFEAM